MTPVQALVPPYILLTAPSLPLPQPLMRKDEFNFVVVENNTPFLRPLPTSERVVGSESIPTGSCFGTNAGADAR